MSTTAVRGRHGQGTGNARTAATLGAGAVWIRAILLGMSIVLNWNGEDLPDEVRQRMPVALRGLPPGRYVLEPVDEAPVLTDEEEAGIHAAIESIRQGKGVSMEVARARIDRILGR